MRAVLADTGPLYAARDPDDQYHNRAQSDIAHLEQVGLPVVIPYPVYLEAYTLVLFRLGPDQAQTFARQLLEGADFINPTSTDYMHATEQAARFSDQRITLFDAVTAILAERLNLPVWTYDHHFDVMRVLVWR